MEPHREDQEKALEPSAATKPKRFRIVKLEERIAPGKGGNGSNNCGGGGYTAPCPYTWNCPSQASCRDGTCGLY